MSTPLIPDGIYKIFNVKYSGFAVDLISGNPFGTVSGFTENTSENQEWKLKNICNNHIILESITAPRSYASSYVQLQGVVLAGSPNATIWLVNNLGGKKYELETLDGKYHWVLPTGKDYATITLEDVKGSPSEDAQWTFHNMDF